MSTLKVMCWNVENLFLPPPGDAPAAEQFQRKLANLATVIDQQQPDVLALQEIGPDGALQALQGALSTSLPHASSGIADGRGIRVAFLCRYAIQRQQNIQPYPALIKAGRPAIRSLTMRRQRRMNRSARPWAVAAWR